MFHSTTAETVLSNSNNNNKYKNENLSLLGDETASSFTDYKKKLNSIYNYDVYDLKNKFKKVTSPYPTTTTSTTTTTTSRTTTPNMRVYNQRYDYYAGASDDAVVDDDDDDVNQEEDQDLDINENENYREANSNYNDLDYDVKHENSDYILNGEDKPNVPTSNVYVAPTKTNVPLSYKALQNEIQLNNERSSAVSEYSSSFVASGSSSISRYNLYKLFAILFQLIFCYLFSN